MFGYLIIISYFCIKIVDMQTKKEILRILEEFKPEAAAKYGITKLGLFGSCARGQQHEGSDVDVCFDGQVPSLVTMARIEIELEQRIGLPVQITMLHDKMPKSFLKNIKRDVIYV